MSTRTLAAASALVCATSAQADVIYNWQQVAASPSIDTSFGQVRFTDEAFTTGRVDFRNGLSSPFPEPPNPIRSYFFGATQGDYRVGAGFTPGFNMLFSFGGLVLGDTISGFAMNALFASNDVEVTLQGSGPGNDLWTVINPGQLEGAPPGCGTQERPCTLRGATGRWILDQSTRPGGGSGQVPLPGTLPLMAFAAFGAAAALRRRT